LNKTDDGIVVCIFTDKCAKYIEETLHIKTIDKEMYFYEGGVYRSGGEDKIRTYISRMFFDEYDIDGESISTRKAQNEIIYKLQALTRVKLEDFDKEIDIINLKNGFFNFRTKEFIAHSPSNQYISMIQHPIEYDPEATCPNIDLIIERLTPNKEHQKALKEWAAYCFYRSYLLKKALVAYGPTGTGKSIFTELLDNLLGKDNSNYLSLSRLNTGRFDLSGLKGICRNQCGETPATEVQAFPNFKGLTGRDEINCDVKHGKPIKFYSFAKLEMMLNEMFKTKDKTDAFYDRLLIIMFLHKFTDEEKRRDAELMDFVKDPKELSGFFNKCIALLPALLDRKAFSYNPSAYAIEALFNQLSEPISEFVDKFVVQDQDGECVGKDQLYTAFELFSELNKTKADKKEFTKFIKALDCIKSYRGPRRNKRYGDRLEIAWPDISFNEEAWNEYGKTFKG
jgi:putative DNA primase/helicase